VSAASFAKYIIAIFLRELGMLNQRRTAWDDARVAACVGAIPGAIQLAKASNQGSMAAGIMSFLVGVIFAGAVGYVIGLIRHRTPRG